MNSTMAVGIPPFVVAFFQDARTQMIIIGILLDLLLGVAAALRTGTYSLKRTAEFYRTMVIPFTLGYVILYAAAVLGLANIPPVGGIALGPIFDEVSRDLGFGALMLNLLGSIGQNLAEIRGASPAPPPPPRAL